MHSSKLTWCKFKLSIFYDTKRNSIYIEPRNHSGYSNSLTYNILVDDIFNKLKSQEFLKLKLVNWKKRENYILFTPFYI